MLKPQSLWYFVMAAPPRQRRLCVRSSTPREKPLRPSRRGENPNHFQVLPRASEEPWPFYSKRLPTLTPPPGSPWASPGDEAEAGLPRHQMSRPTPNLTQPNPVPRRRHPPHSQAAWDPMLGDSGRGGGRGPHVSPLRSQRAAACVRACQGTPTPQRSRQDGSDAPTSHPACPRRSSH